MRFNGGELRPHALALRARELEGHLVQIAAEAARLARDVLQKPGQSSDVNAHGVDDRARGAVRLSGSVHRSLYLK